MYLTILEMKKKYNLKRFEKLLCDNKPIIDEYIAECYNMVNVHGTGMEALLDHADFEELKKDGKYEMYIKMVDDVFKYIDMCKEDALNGVGKVEDIVDASDYLNGINHDANLILSAKNREKRDK